NSPKIEIRKIIWFFTFGVLTISLICLIASFIKIFLHYHATREISASLLFHTELSSPFGLHHIYFSLYVTFCFFFILNEFIQRDIFKNRKWQLGLLLFYFLIFNFLLSSRAGIISFFLIMVLLLLIFLFQTKKFIKGAFIFIALLGGLLIFYFNFPYAKNRITENLSLEMPPTLDSPHEEFNETTGRIGIWICALEVIASNPWFGVGTGDSSDELQKVYLEKGFSIGYVWRFNAHNEFLQTTIRNGILGFIVLFLIFLGYLISFVKFKSYHGLIFLILIFNFAMIESILGTHKGVIFLIFIGLIIYLGHKEFKEPSLVKTRED
ncbi:MAG: O-antigen ligase family protein, partial [Bacteroidota bacterium]|nr:O-antigen ligase family protein [Bacteroidota bacterium]